MTSALIAVGNGYGDNTFQVLMDLAEADRWYAFPLIHAILYDTTSMNDFNTLKPLLNFWADSMINEAPDSFPFCPWPDSNNHGYGSISRFMRSVEEQYHGKPLTENRSFNGLDYITLYNLYYVLNYNQWPRPSSLSAQVPTIDAKIHPNPAKEAINIVLHRHSSNTLVQLLNANGKLIEEATFTGNRYRLVLAQQQPAGMYLLKLQNSTGVSTKKIMISSSEY